MTNTDLEQALERARRQVRVPLDGIHGPGSMAWEVVRESIVFLGGGTAALLQLAHPYVAHGVDQHSSSRASVAGRFERTFRYMFAMSFGDLDSALVAAQRVHRIHTRITGVITEDVGRFKRGHVYRANDAHALLWVYATLVVTSRQVFDLLVHPLDAARSDGFYQSMKSLAALFGIPDELLPRDFAALSAYFERMCDSDEIAVGEPARDMCRYLLQGAVWPFSPLWRWYSTMTAGLLPERLRAAYGLPWRRREQAEFQASVRAIGPLYRALPGSVRHLPAYQEAVHRLTGRKPSRASKLVDRLMAAAVGTIAGDTSTTALRRE